MSFSGFSKYLKPYFWRLLCSALGFMAAVSFLTLGFWKTFIILICCLIGYGIGVFHDKNISALALFRYIGGRIRR